MMKIEMMPVLEHLNHSYQGTIFVWKNADVIWTELTDQGIPKMEMVLARGLKNPQMERQDKALAGQEEPILRQKQLYQQFELHWPLHLCKMKERKIDLIHWQS